MKNFSSKEIHLVPAGGTHIFECCWEAVQIALENRCRVYFQHNAQGYGVDPHDIVEKVYKGGVIVEG